MSCTIQEEGIEGTQKPKVQISGVVISVDGQPLIDADVLLMTPSNRLLTSGITNQLGQFNIDISIVEKIIADGYQLIVEKTAGNPYLHAAYSFDHLLDANVTPITTLVEVLAKESEELTPIESRDTAIKVLDDMDIVGPETWFKLQPPKVDWVQLNNTMQSSDLETWIKQVVTKIKNKEKFPPELVLIFPQTYGGVLNIYIGDGKNPQLMKGVLYQEQISILRAKGDEQYTYELVEPISGLTVTKEGMIQYIPEISSKTEKIPLHVSIKNVITGTGRDFHTELNILETEIVAEGTINEAGGYIADDSLETIASLPPKAVSGASTLRILRSYGENKKPQYIVTSTLATSLPGKLAIPIDETEEIMDVVLNDEVVTESTLQGKWGTRKVWSSRYATLMDQDSVRTNRLSKDAVCPILVDDTQPLVKCSSETSVILESFCLKDQDDQDDMCAGKKPILLINGYNMADIRSNNVSGFGGDYWGTGLREALFQAGYAVYEFRWRTNTSIQSMVPLLASALGIITLDHDKKVTLMGRSIGGLLARAYLQQQIGSNLEPVDNVNTLITIGTPHSGVLQQSASYDGINFPKGQEANAFEGCKQISCHEIGEVIPNTYTVKVNNKSISLVDEFGTTPEPMSVPIFLQKKSEQLADIDILNLVQVTDENNALDEAVNGITYSGQRFNPDNIGSSADVIRLSDNTCYQQPLIHLKDSVENTTRICEKLLGDSLIQEVNYGPKNFNLSTIEDWLSNVSLLGEWDTFSYPKINLIIDTFRSRKHFGSDQVKPGSVRVVLDSVLGEQSTNIDVMNGIHVPIRRIPGIKYYATVSASGHKTYRFDHDFKTSEKYFDLTVYNNNDDPTGRFDGISYTLKDPREYVLFGPVHLTPNKKFEPIDHSIFIFKEDNQDTVPDVYKIVKAGVELYTGEISLFNQKIMMDKLISGRYQLILEENEIHPRQVIPFSVLEDADNMLTVWRPKKESWLSISLAWKKYWPGQNNLSLIVYKKIDEEEKPRIRKIVNYAQDTEETFMPIGGFFRENEREDLQEREALLEVVKFKVHYPDNPTVGVYEIAVISDFNKLRKEDSGEIVDFSRAEVVVTLTYPGGDQITYHPSGGMSSAWTPFQIKNNEMITCKVSCFLGLYYEDSTIEQPY